MVQLIKDLITTSGTDTYTSNLSTKYTAYQQGLYLVKVVSANTGASTLNIDSLGAKNIVMPDGSALIGGEFTAGTTYILLYDGTNFVTGAGATSTTNDNFANADLVFDASHTHDLAGHILTIEDSTAPGNSFVLRLDDAGSGYLTLMATDSSGAFFDFEVNTGQLTYSVDDGTGRTGLIEVNNGYSSIQVADLIGSFPGSGGWIAHGRKLQLIGEATFKAIEATDDSILDTNNRWYPYVVAGELRGRYRNGSAVLSDVTWASTKITPGTNGQFLRTTAGASIWANVLASDIGSGAALTKTDDTNVTLTLGGSPTSALLAATSITVGWTGTLADGRIASASTWNAKIGGSGTTNYVSKFTASGTIGNSLIQDDGSGIGINNAPQSNYKVYINSDKIVALQAVNNAPSGSNNFGLAGSATNANTGSNVGVFGSALLSTTGTNLGVRGQSASQTVTDSTTVIATGSNVGGFFQANATTATSYGIVASADATSNQAASTFIGALLRADNAGTKYAVQLIDGSEGTGKFLKSITSDGKANWATLTYADLSSMTSAQFATLISNETGTGLVVFNNSPTLITPALGTPSALVGTNITGTAAGLTAGNVTTNANLTGHITSVGNAAVLGSFTSAQLATALTDETGSGANVFATSPTLVTPILGIATATTINKVTITTPATGSTLTIADGKTLTVSNTLTFTGTDASSIAFGTGGTVVYTTNNLSVFAATTSAQLAGVISDETGSGALVFGTSPTLVTPILGTPTSVTLTNATGLPVATGISGLGSGIATFLATPSSANLLAAVTDETGTGALVFATSPTLVTPLLGTPTSGTLTNCTGLPIAGLVNSTSTALGVGSIELGHATDTTISRVSAGRIAVEGVNVVTTSSTDTLTNKTLTTPAIASIKGTLTADTDGATITFDKNVSDFHGVTLGGNRILALSNMAAGDRIVLRLLQDGTGSRTVTWFTTIKWAGGSAPTLTTTASKADVFGFLCTSAGNYDGFVIGQNI